MSLVVPNQSGEILFLQYIVGLVDAGNPVLHLYQDLSPDPSLDPIDTTTISDLTECVASGYNSITLVSSEWSVSQDGGGVTTAFFSDQRFTFATSCRVYGYFVTDTSGQLLWLEKFRDAPYDVPVDGGAIIIKPRISMS